MAENRLQFYTCNPFLLVWQVNAVQQPHFLPLQLVTAVSGQSHPKSLGERHSQEAASQLSHGLFLQLATMESNFDFNDEFCLGLRRTYSLQ